MIFYYLISLVTCYHSQRKFTEKLLLYLPMIREVLHQTGPLILTRWSSLPAATPRDSFNTLSPRQNGHHFPYNFFKCIFLNENVWVAIKIWLKFVTKGSINNIPALVQIMAWRRPGDKPLCEPMLTQFTLALQWKSQYLERHSAFPNGVSCLLSWPKKGHLEAAPISMWLERLYIKLALWYWLVESSLPAAPPMKLSQV